MANYREFFVAEPEELAKLAFPQDVQRRPRLAAKGITSDTIGLLDFLVTKNPSREPELVHESDDVHVYEVAQQFCFALVNLSEARFAKLVATLNYGNTSFLVELKALARIAHFRRERLYVCVKPVAGWNEPPEFVPPQFPLRCAVSPSYET